MQDTASMAVMRCLVGLLLLARPASALRGGAYLAQPPHAPFAPCVASRCATPTQLFRPRDDFRNMKRADKPLDDEVTGLKVALGTLGVVLGGGLLGSSLVGLMLGIAAASALMRAEGSTGLWAREIGLQVSEQLARLKSEAQTRNVPDRLRACQATAVSLWSSTRRELATLEQEWRLKAKLGALLTRAWLEVAARAEVGGLTARLDALWTRARATTGLDEWLATMSANIEKRRRHVA